MEQRHYAMQIENPNNESHKIMPSGVLFTPLSQFWITMSLPFPLIFRKPKQYFANFSNSKFENRGGFPPKNTVCLTAKIINCSIRYNEKREMSFSSSKFVRKLCKLGNKFLRNSDICLEDRYYEDKRPSKC